MVLGEKFVRRDADLRQDHRPSVGYAYKIAL